MSVRTRVWCWCSGFPTVGYVSFLAYLHQPWTYSISHIEHLYGLLKILQQQKILKTPTQKKHTQNALNSKTLFRPPFWWPWVVKSGVTFSWRNFWTKFFVRKNLKVWSVSQRPSWTTSTRDGGAPNFAWMGGFFWIVISDLAVSDGRLYSQIVVWRDRTRKFFTKLLMAKQKKTIFYMPKGSMYGIWTLHLLHCLVN